MNAQHYTALLLRSLRGLSAGRAESWLDRNYNKSDARAFFRNPEGNGFTCMRCRRHRDGLRAMQRHVRERNCEPRREVGKR